jgi:PPM family protein phosphatase
VTVELASRAVEIDNGVIEVAGATDRGTVRTENQDAWDAMRRGDGAVLALADGMGGHAGGREAAEAAIEAAVHRLVEAGPAQRVLEAAVYEANAAVGGVRDLIGGDPGTTLVLACVDAGHASVANVGDSRAYLIRDGRPEQLTHDHSWVGEELRAGRLDAGSARHHPRRNIITRALMGDAVTADLFEISLNRGDSLLLCSDGVWEPLTDEMLAELVTVDGPLARTLERLCEAALDAGGRDNVTVVAARIS